MKAQSKKKEKKDQKISTHFLKIHVLIIVTDKGRGVHLKSEGEWSRGMKCSSFTLVHEDLRKVDRALACGEWNGA